MMQTVLASRKFRRKAASILVENSVEIILDCSDGVRLMGSETIHENTKGLFIFLHGWEGSQDSTYVLSCARFIFEQGYSVFRLNFRDHGDTHHLNTELFHSGRLREVFDAVSLVARRNKNIPVYLVGFSLGGNFALRVVRSCKNSSIENLAHVFAISPVIDPWLSSPKVDENPLIRRYFYKKWTTSLEKKAALFPDLYDFDDLYTAKTVMSFSDLFIKKYSDFASSKDYFDSYKIEQDDLSDTSIRTSIIMSADDPVLRANDIMHLNISPCVTRVMLKYGGHNGFFQSLRGPTWYDDYIANAVKADIK